MTGVAASRDHVDRDEVVGLIEYIINVFDVPEECDDLDLCGNQACAECGCLNRKHRLALEGAINVPERKLG